MPGGQLHGHLQGAGPGLAGGLATGGAFMDSEGEPAHGLRQAAYRLEPELCLFVPVDLPRRRHLQLHGYHCRQAQQQREPRQAQKQNQKVPGKPDIEKAVKHYPAQQSGQINQPVAQHSSGHPGSGGGFQDFFQNIPGGPAPGFCAGL